MSATGGSIESATLAGREFAVAADADVSRALGGFTNEFEMNGNGTGRTVKTRVPWMLDGLQVSIDDDNDDLEFLQNLADGPLFVVTMTTVTGTTYNGTGQITGDVQASTQNTTATLNLKGPQKLTK